MMKVSATPTLQWSSGGKKPSSGTGSKIPIAISAGTLSVKQTLLPRYLDLSFSIKYRR